MGERMNKLYFLIGLPRSGKSTFAKKWVQNRINILENGGYTENKRISCCKNKFYQPDVPRVIVRSDDIRLACGHRWNGYIEPYINATKLVMIRALLNEHDVLVDGTHTTKKSIMELLNIDKNAIPFLIKENPEICKKRAKESGQEDLLPVINRMYDQLFAINEGQYMVDNVYKNIDKMREKVFDIRITD